MADHKSYNKKKKMTTYASDVYNILVPSNYYLNIIEITNSDQQFNFTFPNSFVPGAYNLASTVIIQSNLTEVSATFILPDARLSSVGNISAIVNESTVNVDLVDFEGNQIINTMTSGQYYLLVLIKNTTAAGEWQIIQIGTAPSQANAAALAGQGLVAINSRLNVDIIVNDIASPVVLDNTYLATMYNWTGSGTEVQNLPQGIDITPGFFMYVRNSGLPGSNTQITFAPANGGKVDGNPALGLSINQSCILVHSNGDNWKTIGLGLFSYGNGVELSNTGIRVTNGSNSIPSYSFISNPVTGMYLDENDAICFTLGADKKYTFASTAFTVKEDVSINWGNNPLLFYMGMYP